MELPTDRGFVAIIENVDGSYRAEVFASEGDDEPFATHSHVRHVVDQKGGALKSAATKGKRVSRQPLDVFWEESTDTLFLAPVSTLPL